MTATLPEAPTRPTGPATAWHDVCALTDLEPLWGEAARVAGRQVALYRVDGTTVLAADHRDPRTGACVMARGILGSRGAAVTVASPLHKEVYDLGSGRCLSGDGPELPVHPVLVRDGRVLVALPSAPPVVGELPGGRP
ncbi:nitrite reductase [Kocuria sp. CNJ-770]|uniref:Nitrite reductase small subunit NirD n=1 Tax=Kocuria oceani TaxID=988827 RepID=A0ABV9TH46_9MICC|nr:MULTISPECIES: nitrite reductase small subunit NirD [Kocuria]OLT07495.1 nitrite reductase [Kocuria sp. CNJ-770]